MKVIIAGSRAIQHPPLIEDAVLKSGFQVTSTISGGALGVDTLGELWAKRNGIPFEMVRPVYGNGVNPKLAPKVRNFTMAEKADALIAIWDGFSGGTAHMIAAMVAKSKPVYVSVPADVAS